VRGQKDDPVLWSWVVRPISTRLGRIAASFDRDLLDRALADAWARPARFVA